MTKNKHHKQRGISLLEVLLAVGVLASLLAIGTVITTDLARQIVNEKASNQMLTLQRAGEEYATANFTKLLSSSVPGNIAFPPGPPNKTKRISVATLIADGFLPNGFDEENLLNLNMAVYLRNATNAAAGSIETIEIITVTEPTAATPNGQVYKWILDTALFGNGKLGILSNIGAGFNNVSFRSTNGSWTVPIASLTGYTPTVPTAATNPSGYIAAYGRTTTEDVFDPDVLYRIPIAGQPDLNRMQAPLNMNNHDIVDAGTITADQLNVANATLNGTGRYALSSTGTINFGAGTTSMSGDMIVYGRDPALGNSFTATNADLGTGSLTSESITTNTLTAGADGIVADNLVTNNATSLDLITNNSMNLSVNNLNTSNLQIGGTGGANVINANTLTSDNLVAGNASVTGNMSIDNDGISVIQDMNVGGNASIKSLRANDTSVFSDLCYTSGAQDGIEGC